MRIGCVVSDNEHIVWAEKCAFDYLELKGDFLLKLSRDGTYNRLRGFKSLSIEAMTSPLPREFGARIVGKDSNLKYALQIFTYMLDLAANLGIKKIVLGSGQARTIPEKFCPNRASEQFKDFVVEAKHLCISRDQKLTIEPLHSGETNFINSCVEAQNIIKDITDVSITADCYHIFTEQLSVEDELSRSDVIHAHTSYLPRGSGEFREDYQVPFLNTLQSLGCNEISIEERFTSFESMQEILLKLRQESLNIP